MHNSPYEFYKVTFDNFKVLCTQCLKAKFSENLI